MGLQINFGLQNKPKLNTKVKPAQFPQLGLH